MRIKLAFPIFNSEWLTVLRGFHNSGQPIGLQIMFISYRLSRKAMGYFASISILVSEVTGFELRTSTSPLMWPQTSFSKGTDQQTNN